jgi:hypothetical protein
MELAVQSAAMACGDGVSSQQSCQKENRTAPDALSAPAVDGATLASRDSPVAPSRNRSITAPAIALLLLPHHFSTCSALLQLALPAFGISYASFLGHFAGKTHFHSPRRALVFGWVPHWHTRNQPQRSRRPRVVGAKLNT